jgi:hypothetical protein
MYWSDKYILLRYSRKPPMIDESLLKSILQTLPPCLIFHLIGSIYAYGVPGVLVDEQDPNVLEFIDRVKDSNSIYTY